MTDVTDPGLVYNRKTQSPEGFIREREDAVFDVRSLQIAGQYILAGVGRQYPSDDGEEKCCRLYFLLDTRTRQRTRFSDYNALIATAVKLGAQPKLEKIDVVHAKCRYTWFDALAALAMFGVPLLCAWLLLRWIMPIRTSEDALPRAI